MPTPTMANDTDIKKLISFVADSEALAAELLTGFSFQEVVDLIRVATEVKSDIGSPDVYIPEWEALDDAARADLIAYVTTAIKYPANVQVEVWTQKLLQAAVLLSQLS